jgi:hypothetical protein
VDDENGALYQIDKIEYMESADAVVGYRRAMDGRLHKYDDDPMCMVLWDCYERSATRSTVRETLRRQAKEAGGNITREGHEDVS